MRTALYVRVSTNNQVQMQTIDHQLQLLTQHLEKCQESLTSEQIFRDDGYSGATLNRPGLDHLRDAVRHHEFDRILITAPDRLARNYVHQMVLLEEFEQAGCSVEFLEHPMSQDPHDQLVLQIRGAVAEYERTLITERMRRGRNMKLQAGSLLPWTHRLYGYQINPDHPRDPSGVTCDSVESAVVAELFRRYLEMGTSLYALSRFLHEQHIPSPTGKPWWGLATIQGILTNPTYTGAIYIGRNRYRAPQIRRSATHPIGRSHETALPTPPEEWTQVASIPAIISEELFAQVQTKLATNQRFARRNNTVHTYLLRSLVSCGLCLRSCIARTNTKYAYYTCSGKGPTMMTGMANPCESRFIPAAQLDEIVWKDLCEVICHPDSIAVALERAHGGHWLPQELQARREQFRKARLSIEHQKNRLMEAYLHEIIPLAEFERRRRELDQKEENIAHLEVQLQAQVEQQGHLAQLTMGMIDFCQRISQGLEQATWEQKR